MPLQIFSHLSFRFVDNTLLARITCQLGEELQMMSVSNISEHSAVK